MEGGRRQAGAALCLDEERLLIRYQQPEPEFNSDCIQRTGAGNDNGERRRAERIRERHRRGAARHVQQDTQLFLYGRTSIALVHARANAQSMHTDSWLLVMSTQLIGFSMGGIARRFLVAPPSMSASFPLLCLSTLSY